jgi:hypothetical protein
MLATLILIQHKTIKDVSNRGNSKDGSDYITDNDLYFIGGFFAYLAFYFGYNFCLQTFFGFVL